MEGAYQHIIADLFASIGALIAGIGIILFRAFWLDTATSVIVAILILKSGLSITKRSVKVLIEATPDGVDLDQIRTDIKAIYGVVDVHDFHAWRVTDGFDLITAHVIVTSYDMSELIKILQLLYQENMDLTIQHFKLNNMLVQKLMKIVNYNYFSTL